MSLPSDLCTLEQVYEWIGLPPLNPGPNYQTPDALVGSLISSATALITSYIGYQLYPVQAFNLTLDGTGNSSIVLPVQPIQTITNLQICATVIPPRGQPSGYGTGDGYSFDPSSSVLNLTGYRIPRGFQIVSVSGTAGYPSIPLDVNQACIELVAFKLKQKDHTGVDSLSKTGANVTETTHYLLGDMSPEVKAVLDRYKRTNCWT